ncbi:MAG: hypothetical protein H6R27_1820 [Proteobacteria bacterium]|nr:hypothetical protein [Pseudomonadota bacterium]
MIPTWFKLAYTAFVAVVLVTWLRHYGWRNLLWFSDIALIGAVPALWLESRGIASVLAVAVLGPELLWNLDFALRLATKRRVIGLTEYMFEHERPRVLRLLSLFHVPLPLVLLWMLAAYGYAAAIALPGAVVLAALILPASRLLGSAEANINWTYGLARVQSRLSPVAYVALLFAGFVLGVFLPTDQLLRRLFSAAAA